MSPKVRTDSPSGSGVGALKSRVALRRDTSVAIASSEKPEAMMTSAWGPAAISAATSASTYAP